KHGGRAFKGVIAGVLTGVFGFVADVFVFVIVEIIHFPAELAQNVGARGWPGALSARTRRRFAAHPVAQREQRYRPAELLLHQGFGVVGFDCVAAFELDAQMLGAAFDTRHGLSQRAGDAHVVDIPTLAPVEIRTFGQLRAAHADLAAELPAFAIIAAGANAGAAATGQ